MMRLILAATLLTAVTAPALAQTGSADHSAHHVAQAKAANALSDGEVRKVDGDAKKITIRHGPLQTLDMPPMTMVFQTKDPALLGKAKAGDKIRFRAEKEGSAYVVTHIEPAN